MKKQFKKKVLSMLAALSILASMVTALPISAEDWGDYTYVVEDGKAIITGFKQENAGEVVIPSTINNYPVTQIYTKAFYNRDNISAVTIPNSVTTIGDSAFQDCNGITSVTIPNSVTSIGASAFQGCAITSLTIPNSVTNVEVGAFMSCGNLENVILSENMTNIKRSTFNSCKSLRTITIPKSIVNIENLAFNNCLLKDIYFTGGIKDWEKISIDSWGNDLASALIHYNSSMPNNTTVTPAPATVVPATTAPATAVPAPATPPPAPTGTNTNTTTVINNNTTNTVITNNTQTNNNITNNTTTNNNITTNTNITNNITNNVSLILYIGKTTANVGGESVENDVAPIVRNDRTMLPARFVAEQLGAKVDWNQDLKQVIITKGDKLITIPIGSDKAYVNNEAQLLDSPAFVENDRTYTPVRFIAENLDADVQWNGNDQSVTITEK